ncbi:MAG: MASE1 domain-containing protein [Oculatellaceae cyanobacterium Prado106]|nr:MASE1 domain-containing protein [Oculatellaceae cyanobacterium Prado106]
MDQPSLPASSLATHRHLSFLNQTWLLSGIVALLIFGSGQFSFTFASIDEVTPVWLPSGVALGAVLLLGWRVLPGVALGFGVLDITWYKSLVIGGLVSLGETSETVLASYLIHRFIRTEQIFSQVQSTIFFILTALIAPIFNTTFGTTVLYFAQKIQLTEFMMVWRIWWTADTVGILLFTPFLKTWLRQIPNFKLSSRLRWVEFVTYLATLVLVDHWVFVDGTPLEYMFLPLMLWSAFRFGQHCTTLSLAVVSITSLVATARSAGPFADSTQNNNLLLLQSFVAVIAVTALLLTAILSEQRTAQASLKQSNEMLEDRVEERTAALTQTLSELRRTQGQLVQTEKMSSLGQLVAGVAHEINNPVNFIHGNLNPAQEYATDLLRILHLYQAEYPNPSAKIQEELEEVDLKFLEEDLSKLLRSMKVGSERIRDIVKSLRTFSRLDEAELKAVDMHEGVESTLMILQNRLKMKPNFPGIQVVKEYGELPLVECFSGELNQVLMNILANAIDAVEDRYKASLKDSKAIADESYPPYVPSITIRTSCPESGWVAIAIQDNGIGMSESILAKLFDPFYTTKAVGVGTGLGLSISYQIVTQTHQGKLYCRSKLGEGSEFFIEIPVCQKTV